MYQLLRMGLITAATVLLLWLAGHVLLVIFAGLLLAVAINGLTTALTRHTRLAYGWAFLCVTAILGVGLIATIYMSAPRIIGHSYQVLNDASGTLQQLLQKISHMVPGLQHPPKPLPSLSQLTSDFFDLGAALTDFAVASMIICFVGFYAALNPRWYIDGFIRMFPNSLAPRMHATLHEIGYSLQQWLLGRAVMMTSVGLLTLMSLSLLSIPLAPTLSLIAGLLTFVPYFGALVSSVPALLIAFAQRPIDAVYVAIVYLAAHAIEGYILAPLVQQKTVNLPPALMLGSQAFLGTLFGATGAALAAPIVVVLMAVLRTVNLVDGADDEPDANPRYRRTSP